MNDEYARENAAEKVYGYFLPSPTKPGGDASEFERARAECLQHLRFQIDMIESLTFAQFAKDRLK